MISGFSEILLVFFIRICFGGFRLEDSSDEMLPALCVTDLGNLYNMCEQLLYCTHYIAT